MYRNGTLLASAAGHAAALAPPTTGGTSCHRVCDERAARPSEPSAGGDGGWLHGPPAGKPWCGRLPVGLPAFAQLIRGDHDGARGDDLGEPRDCAREQAADALVAHDRPQGLEGAAALGTRLGQLLSRLDSGPRPPAELASFLASSPRLVPARVTMRKSKWCRLVAEVAG